MLGETYFDDIEEVSKVEDKKKKNKKSTSKKAKKQKHQNIMKALPPTCYSCTAHPTDYLRLIPEPAANRPTCKSCGFKLGGKLGYLICSKSASCFFLCSSCKVCSNNHVLRKMVSLNHFNDNELYTQNKFKCHACALQKQVDSSRGVYHCSACAFSICPDCVTKTDALWQEKNVSQDEDDDEWEDI